MEKGEQALTAVHSEIARYSQNIKQPVPWDFSNQILYDLCKQHPAHVDEGVILAKTIMIGRVYAAALERNAIKKKKSKEYLIEDPDAVGTIGDDFYIDRVVPLFKSFFGQSIVQDLENSIRSQPSRREAIQLQSLFATALKKLQRGRKTSFSSKYLHFHFRDHFFMFDTRAREALPYLKSFIESRVRRSIDYNKYSITKNFENKDDSYLVFENCCHTLKSELDKLDIISTNRQFDNLLIHIANGIQRSNTKS